MGGYRAALGGIDDAVAEVDSLARKMAGEMNAVHRVGLDLTGAPGGDMFSLDDWTLTRAAGNLGFARAEITPDAAVDDGNRHPGSPGCPWARRKSTHALGSRRPL